MLSDEQGGKLVRDAWVAWAKTQPDPKPSWLVPWDLLDEQSKSADIAIYHALRLHFSQLANLDRELVNAAEIRLRLTNAWSVS